jgi:hypothetical protein
MVRIMGFIIDFPPEAFYLLRLVMSPSSRLVVIGLQGVAEKHIILLKSIPLLKGASLMHI